MTQPKEKFSHDKGDHYEIKNEFYKECCDLLDRIKETDGKPYLPFAMDISVLVKTYGGKL